MKHYFIAQIMCIFPFLAASCATNETKVEASTPAASAPIVSSASKSKYTQGYQVPIGAFGCKADKSPIIFRIIDSKTYDSQGGKIGNYSVLNDDLIFFQSAALQGYFGQVMGPKKIRIFKTVGTKRQTYYCAMN